MMSTPGRWTGFRIAELAILTAFAVFLLRNALAYPFIAGIDASEHRAYAWELAVNGQLGTSGSYYTPPGWYVLAGELLKLGDQLDLSEVELPAQLLSAALVVGSAILLLAATERVFPGRPWVRLWSLAIFCTCPAVVKPAAMLHPQPLVLFLTLLALVGLVSLLAAPRWTLQAGIALGLALGSAQLVRSVGLWVYAVAALAIAVAVVVGTRGTRRRMAAVGATALVIGALVPLPWYVYLQVEYGDPVFGGRPEIVQGAPEPGGTTRAGTPIRLPTATAPAEPRAARAPLSFFTATGLPEAITHPYRGRGEEPFAAILLADTWGDYFGEWSWGMPTAALDPPDRQRLVVQGIVGVLLTFVSLTGLVALAVLVGRSLRQRLRQLPIVVLPLVAVASLVLYAWRYPSADDDTVKALFLLPAAPAFAMGFGFATDVVRSALGRDAKVVLGAALAGLLLVCAHFGLA